MFRRRNLADVGFHKAGFSTLVLLLSEQFTPIG